jgi:hypothetical protein
VDESAKPPVPASQSHPPAPAQRQAATQLQLDRAALERVLARAAELQVTGTDPSELLTEAQLVEIGSEVGLLPQHLRQALAEERARLAQPSATGALSRMFGPGEVHARRMLRGDPAAMLQVLDAWLQRTESLQVKRRFQDRMLWEPKKGFMSEMQRSFDIAGRGYHLCRAQEIAASVVPVDEARVLVHVSADIRPSRTNRLLTGGVVSGSGAATAGILLLLGVFAPVAAGAAVVGAGSGYLIARSHNPVVERVQLALEQLLDRLERGEMPKGGLMTNLRNMASIREF